MTRLFDILKLLAEKEVSFCLQNQPRWAFFNLMVVDRYKKAHYISGTLEKVSEGLDIIWGHLVDGPAPKPKTAETKIGNSIVPSMPMPPGMPKPPLQQG